MKLSIKAVLSTTLLLLFVVLMFSGALLYFGRTGVVLGFSRHFLRAAHLRAALIMCVLVPIHLFFNMRLFKSELKSLRGAKYRDKGK